MLVDPKSQAADDAPAPSEPRVPQPVPASGAKPLLVIIVALALAAAAWRLFVGPFGHAEPTPVAAVKTAAVVRTGEHIMVPESSPVRGAIMIAPVSMKDVRRDLVLPAVVEADPARLIKVLPPLSGRVMQLKVQLGERVTADQPLLVLELARPCPGLCGL